MLLAWTLSPAFAVEPNEEMLAALRPYHGFVGDWKGTGTSEKSSGWSETIESTWGFREKDGRVSINFYIEGGEVFKVGLLTYDPSAKEFAFLGRDEAGNVLRFVGKPFGSQGLRLARVDGGAKDNFDRLEIKLVRAGDKLMYTLAKKKGKTAFETVAEVEQFREGAPLESFTEGPRCLVTGGAGRVAVEYQGQTYHVACSASKEEFLARPEKYLKKAAK